MTEKKKVKQGEGLDEEIAVLRELIRLAMNKQSETATVNGISKLTKTVSQALVALARSLQVKSELDLAKGDSGVMLREALLELEEEWPEFKQLVSKYYPAQKEAEE